MEKTTILKNKLKTEPPKENYSFYLSKLLAEADQNQAESKTVRRIALVLACISSGITSLAEIADTSKLSRSTVHRLLKGMERSSLVIHDSSQKRYYLGSLIRYLVGVPDITHKYLVNSARLEMARLGEATDETIILGIKIGLNHVTLHSISSTYDLRVVEPQKNVGNLSLGASGKVLLSQLDDKELKEVVSYIQFNLPTNVNKDDLMTAIKKIQGQGYAVSSGERLFGATMISAPIFGYNTPAAISIIGPDARVLPRLPNYTQKLTTTAERISKNIAEAKE